MAAPRDSVFHFLKVAYEKSQNQKNKIMQTVEYLNLDRNLDNIGFDEDSSDYYSENSGD